MTTARKPCPSDVSDEEWALVAPYLCLLREDAPQRGHSLADRSRWRWMPNDLPPWAPTTSSCRSRYREAI